MIVSETPSGQRSSSRVPACSNVWLQCRRVGTDGPNLANGLLDISGDGLQLLAKELLTAGDTVEVVLSGSSVSGSIRRNGQVRWAVPLGAEACCAGLQFHEPLSQDQTEALIAPIREPTGEDEACADNLRQAATP